MSRSQLMFGTVAALGLAVVLTGVGDSSLAIACDTSAKSAGATASCCSKDKNASAASIEAGKVKHTRLTAASTTGACTRNAAVTASADGCNRTTAMAAGAGCVHSKNVAAAAGCEKGTAMAAGAGSCCESTKSAKTAAMHGCSEAETASLKGSVDALPYSENRRVVLAGTYECGHCALNITEECAPMLKTADGKVYPLMDNARVHAMREAKCANGVEVSGLVRKLDGVKYIDVKSYRAL